MKTLACVGSAVLDRIFNVGDLPGCSGKFVATGYTEVGGGPAATAAVAVARLGWPVDLIAPVGDDPGAVAIIDELAGYGVGTAFVRRIPGGASSTSAILVDRAGERMIVNYRHPAVDAQIEWLGEVDFSGFAGVLADVRWPRGSESALAAARRAGVPTVLDADTCPDDISPLARLADHIVFSQPGLARFTGEHGVERGLRAAADVVEGHVYVTAGREGGYWLERSKLGHLKAFQVDVADTTGAGDVFHGAFLVALAEGLTGEAAMRFASAAAALKCTRPGGRLGIPSRSQLETFLRENDARDRSLEAG